MRQAFVRALGELAEQDARILVLTGDLGYLVFEPFAERFPDRFINVGVAEQNLIGLATGLAEAGFLPFVYSIVPFAVLRPYEFLRNGPVLHRLPVRIAGVGGGLEYALNGPSHYGLEDVAVTRVLPGLSVIAPADHEQTRSALQATWDRPGPIYYRLGKDDHTVVPGLRGRFDLGRVQELQTGDDLLLVTMGSIATQAVDAADRLTRAGLSCGLAVVASISPRPDADLARLAARVPLVVTVEAHYVNGGLGSMVSELVATQGLSCRVLRCGVESDGDGLVGTLDDLYEHHGLSSARLAARAREALRTVSGQEPGTASAAGSAPGVTGPTDR